MRKIMLFGLLVLEAYSALPTVDAGNIAQSTITAAQTTATYLKQVTDWQQTLAHYNDVINKAQRQIETASGVKSAISNFNDISRLYSDFGQIYNNIDSFNKEVLKDPQGFINKQLSDRYQKYQIFDNCKGRQGEELNLCLRQKLNYAFAYNELDENQKRVKTLNESIQDLDYKMRQSQDMKESIDWANQMSLANLQMQHLQLKIAQDNQRFQIEQKELEDRRRQLLSKSATTKVSSGSRLNKN